MSSSLSTHVASYGITFTRKLDVNLLCLRQRSAGKGTLFSELSMRPCMTIYQKFVNTTSYKPLVGISPHLQVGK